MTKQAATRDTGTTQQKTRKRNLAPLGVGGQWGGVACLPSAVLAGVASLLIQKDTQERTTVRMQGM